MENPQEKKENNELGQPVEPMPVEPMPVEPMPVEPMPQENIELPPTNASEILDKEEQELPEPQSPGFVPPVPTPMPSARSVRKTKGKRCPKGCMKKTRCRGTIRGGKRSKKSRKVRKNKTRKHKK
jgi:hypothetical protein